WKSVIRDWISEITEDFNAAPDTRRTCHKVEIMTLLFYSTWCKLFRNIADNKPPPTYSIETNEDSEIQRHHSLEKRKCVREWLTETEGDARKKVGCREIRPLQLLRHLLAQVKTLHHHDRYGEF